MPLGFVANLAPGPRSGQARCCKKWGRPVRKQEVRPRLYNVTPMNVGGPARKRRLNSATPAKIVFALVKPRRACTESLLAMKLFRTKEERRASTWHRPVPLVIKGRRTLILFARSQWAVQPCFTQRAIVSLPCLSGGHPAPHDHPRVMHHAQSSNRHPTPRQDPPPIPGMIVAGRDSFAAADSVLSRYRGRASRARATWH
jgi:hypothetical protein